ncbi:MAG TPA: dihydrofolate reductase [Microscillaceae bacterium]|nr:dihydrofolate reductase [Microscillaceae bacterium]
MKKVKLYIAASLDGFIARKDHSLDWLDALPNPEKTDYGYYAFYESIDTVLMGRSTYEVILGFDVDWPYPDAQTIIFSRSSEVNITTPNTRLVNEDIKTYVTKLRQEKGKDIWLAGGGQLVTSFLNEGLIDEMIVSITPVILGEGVPLFAQTPKETKLKLTDAQHFGSGMVNVTYTVIKD